MDLGIGGRRALVCAASRGLGLACATALAREGVAVTIIGRDGDGLRTAAEAIRASNPDAEVESAVGDLGTEHGRAAALAACPAPDILINNNGGPPPGDFRRLAADDWRQAVEANMIAPIEMIRACADDMASRGWGRIVNITSSAVKAPMSALSLSNGPRSGLTGFVGGVARELASKGVIMNNLLPGPFETERMRAVIAARASASSPPPVGRYGRPAEFGSVCAFLCSEHVGYLVGQNILLDGGSFPGAF